MDKQHTIPLFFVVLYSPPMCLLSFQCQIIKLSHVFLSYLRAYRRGPLIRQLSTVTQQSVDLAVTLKAHGHRGRGPLPLGSSQSCAHPTFFDLFYFI